MKRYWIIFGGIAAAVVVSVGGTLSAQEKSPARVDMRERAAAGDLEAVRADASMALRAEQLRREGRMAEAADFEAARRSGVAGKVLEENAERLLNRTPSEERFPESLVHLQQASRRSELARQQITGGGSQEDEGGDRSLRRELEILRDEVAELRRELLQLRIEMRLLRETQETQQEPKDRPE